MNTNDTATTALDPAIPGRMLAEAVKEKTAAEVKAISDEVDRRRREQFRELDELLAALDREHVDELLRRAVDATFRVATGTTRSDTLDHIAMVEKTVYMMPEDVVTAVEGARSAAQPGQVPIALLAQRAGTGWGDARKPGTAAFKKIYAVIDLSTWFPPAAADADFAFVTSPGGFEAHPPSRQRNRARDPFDV